MTIAICILLAILLAASLLYNYTKKREFRNLNLALLAIQNIDTNKQLTTATADKDIAKFVATINAMLHTNRQNAVEIARTEANLKRAITNISHDLRTPLTAAKGYLQMLESPTLDETTRLSYLQIIGERLNVQAALMDSLFEFAKVIEGELPSIQENINLCNIVRDALSASYDQFAQKGFNVDVNIPETPILASGNKNAAERIVQNLIKNAHIHGKDYIRIVVSESGIEIQNKAENLNEIDPTQLFDRFYIADGARTSKTTGLGLAIVRELTAQMGWTVEAKIVGEMYVCRIHIVTGM